MRNLQVVLVFAVLSTTATFGCSCADDEGEDSTAVGGAGANGAGANGNGANGTGASGEGANGAGPNASPGEADDFVGPFASWVNAKTDRTYGGAVGDGVSDDTAALQAAIDHLRDDGFARVLYLPPGTYRITNTLLLQDLDDAHLVGDDPETVTLLWDGPPGDDMMWVDAVNGTKFERITFEGQGQAKSGIRQEVSQQYGNYSGMNLYQDLIFQNLEYGLRSPAELSCFQADAEIVVERSLFRSISVAGVEASSANSFNWFVWHSRFEDCAIGVQNGPVTNDGACAGNGYAEIFVNQSTFLRSTNSDVKNVAAARGNLSVESRAFQRHDPFVGRPIADQQSFFGNVILDPLDSVAIDIASPIAYVVDNTIRSASGTVGPVIQGKAHLAAIGNQLTVEGGIAATGRITDVDNTVVASSAIEVQVPEAVPFAVKRAREIFEVEPSAQGVSDEEIQAAVDAAVAFEASNPGSRPVVHLSGANGSLNIDSAVVIPANTDIQIIGDGWKTAVVFDDESVTDKPVFHVLGPTKVRFQDIFVWGNRPGAPEANATAAVLVTGGDQPDIEDVRLVRE
jgi:hypothetical protein